MQPQAVKLPDLNDPKIQELAGKAQAMYENLDADQKRNIADSAKEMLKQAQNLQASMQPKQPEVKIEEPVYQPVEADIELTEESSEELVPEVETKTEMSPLAAQIAADIEQQPILQPNTQKRNSPPVINTSKPVESGTITISIVSAPEPLVEAVQ